MRLDVLCLQNDLGFREAARVVHVEGVVDDHQLCIPICECRESRVVICREAVQPVDLPKHALAPERRRRERADQAPPRPTRE